MKTLLFHIFLIFSITVKSQLPGSKLSGVINEKLIEHLVKEGIDNIRESKSLSTLANDSILYLAANFHAKYLNITKKLSHEESNDSMRTPQMRAEYFGAVNYGVGENILYIELGGKVKTKKGKTFYINSYQDAADLMVRNWVNSPSHYKNIITANYQITGLSVNIDYEKKRIYAVQKFAKVNFKYVFNENKSMFLYSNYISPITIESHKQMNWDKYKEKYPYKIKPLNKKSPEYNKGIKVLNKSAGFQRLKVVHNSIYLEMNLNADGLVNFLSKNKDGLAIEYINYLPFDCGNDQYYSRPSRRNGKSQLSDTLLFPVYRKDLMKGFKPKRKSTGSRIKAELRKKDKERNLFQKIIDGYNMPYYPDKFKYKLAKIPKNIEWGYYEMNLVYIKNKQIYRVQHFNGICGEFYEEFNKLDFTSEFGDITFMPIAKKRDLNFNFHFKRGSSSYNYQDLKPVLDSLTEDAFIVLSAKVDAYSSVEGSEKKNKEIQQKRAKSIIEALESKQSTKIHPTINTHTNWPLFHTQIKEIDQLSSLRTLDSVEILKKLKDKEFIKSIEPFLSKQRIAKIDIKTVFDLNDSTLPYLIQQKYIYHQNIMKIKKKNYDNFIAKNLSDTLLRQEMKDSTLHELDTLKSIQLFAFNKIKSGDWDISFINKLDYLSVDWTTDLYLNHFYMERFLKIPSNKRKYTIKEFQSCTSIENFHGKGAFNYLRFLIKQWGGENPLTDFKTEDIQKLLEKIEYQCPELIADLLKLKINFWFKAAQFHFHKKEINLKNEYLIRIFLHYRDKKITENHALKLAKFFVHFENYKPAQIILNKFHDTTKNEETLAYIYKLFNYNNIEENNNEFAEQCIKIRGRMSINNWCGMFIGPCNISFQVLDHEGLRNFYCQECSGIKNDIQKIMTD